MSGTYSIGWFAQKMNCRDCDTLPYISLNHLARWNLWNDKPLCTTVPVTMVINWFKGRGRDPNRQHNALLPAFTIMKLLALFSFLFAALPLLVSGVTVPGASTPLFYLVANGPDSAGVNFLPVRLHGGSNYFAILTGTGPIAKFYFFQGHLVALDPQVTPPGTPWRALVNTQQTGTATCATFGQFGTVQGSSTNKCASYDTFGLQSNQENSQLGAHLVFNYAGGFFVCGTLKEVYYKADTSQGPSDCTPIELATVPVVE